MRKYGLLISFIIALTFVSCTIMFVKTKTRTKEIKFEVKVNNTDTINHKK